MAKGTRSPQSKAQAAATKAANKYDRTGFKMGRGDMHRSVIAALATRGYTYLCTIVAGMSTHAVRELDKACKGDPAVAVDLILRNSQSPPADGTPTAK